MKNRIVLTLILFLCFLSACSQKETELEDEGIDFFEKEFHDESENWEVKLQLIETPIDQVFMETGISTFKYLKDDKPRAFNYEMIYGDPIKYTVTPIENTILTQDQDEFKVAKDQQRLIEEVCFGQFTLKVLWNDNEGEPQEDSFVFKDHQNPQCDHIVPMAPRGDIN